MYNQHISTLMAEDGTPIRILPLRENKGALASLALYLLLTLGIILYTLVAA